MTDQKLVWTREEIAAMPFVFGHPLDEGAEVTLFGLSRLSGLAQTGVTLAHLAPGKAAFPLHRHHGDDEWIYIIDGDGTLTLDDADHPLSAGSFAAFPAGGPAHQLRNSGDRTLVYLMGGSAVPLDVVDFPAQNQRMMRTGAAPDAAQAGPLDSFAPFNFFTRTKPPGAPDD